ncbi:MAG: peptidoglycan editing factor PgeF [candidate division FCPU426 bacterium]
MARLFKFEREAGIGFWTLPEWRRRGIQVCCSCRQGGISLPPFDTLNLGLSTADRREHVLANRRAFFQAARLGPLLPVIARQSHETDIRQVGRRDAGRGWQSLRTAFKRTDGMITSVPGLPLAVTVADCLPVLLADNRGRVVAAVHAGWRGLVRGVIQAAVAAFWDLYRIPPETILAAIGPSIGPEAFAVKGEALKLLKAVAPHAVKPWKGSGTRFDLWEAAERVLCQCGIARERICLLGQSTALERELYFSHRRDGETGRMLGIIQIIPA